MTDKPGPFHNPFSVLGGNRPAAKPDPAPATTEPVIPAPGTRSIARAVVRMERARRGGKVVTVVSHLGLDGAGLEHWLKDLKATLGCGGTVEGDTIMLQGDQRKRLPPLLRARRVKKVDGA